MSDELLFSLTLPLAIALGGIFIKFIQLCHGAREEEFEARKEAVAHANANRLDAEKSR